jgi:single-strand DNA-binding protein
VAGVNRIILVGHVGRDPELDTTGSNARCKFTMATTETYTDKQGKRQEKTQWHNIVLWGRLAEVAGEYLKKGRQVFISGPVEYRKYQDKDGNDRYITEIKGLEMQMLGGDTSQGNTRDQPRSNPRQNSTKTTTRKPVAEDPDDDLPF